MDFSGEKEGKKENPIIKTWERCKSLGRGSQKTSKFVGTIKSKSKSFARLHFHPNPSVDDDQRSTTSTSRKRRVAPEGCFSVYVGEEKQRFEIRTEYANHPLFKALLEEAESEYGYNPQGPLALPCKVDVFYKVLMAVDSNHDHETIHHPPQGCGFSKKYYRLP